MRVQGNLYSWTHGQSMLVGFKYNSLKLTKNLNFLLIEKKIVSMSSSEEQDRESMPREVQEVL